MTDGKLRNRGNILLQQGCFLGDTSGRTKQEKEKSVFAIASKNAEFSVKFLSSEKKKVFARLKKRFKKYSNEKIKTIMHVVNIYSPLGEYPAACCDKLN